jgi:hypothetical protein
VEGQRGWGEREVREGEEDVVCGGEARECVDGVVACCGVDVGGAVACFEDDVLGFDLGEPGQVVGVLGWV